MSSFDSLIYVKKSFQVVCADYFIFFANPWTQRSAKVFLLPAVRVWVVTNR